MEQMEEIERLGRLEKLPRTPCQHTAISSELYCGDCSHKFNYQELAHYRELNFLLSETAKSNWLEALNPVRKAALLWPYEVQQRIAALQIGVAQPNSPPVRMYAYLATLKVLGDLPLTKNEKLSPEAYTAFEEYVQSERSILEAEYRATYTRLPLQNQTFDVLSRQEILRYANYLIEAMQKRDWLESAALDVLTEKYKAEAVELAAEAKVLEEERQRQKAVQEAQEREFARQQQAQVRQMLEQAMATQMPNPYRPAEPKPAKPPREFKWENVWNALLSETTLRALLYLGALLVVVAAILFMTFNWNTFPAIIQASTFLAVDGLFYGLGFFILNKLNLRRAGLSFVAIGAALLPIAVYGYSRPELLNLNASLTWSVVSLVALLGYVATANFVRERLFSYLTSIAALNAVLAVCFTLGLSAEWLLIPAIVTAAGLVWLDGWLEKQQETELANAPFWVGHVTVSVGALGLFSYYINAVVNKQDSISLQFALGATWWLAAAFYGWQSWQSQKPSLLYSYGCAVSCAVATYLTLHKFAPAEWQSFLFGVLGGCYVLFQSLHDLVPRLNQDNNSKKWKLEEIFNPHKPFNSFGWLLLIGSVVMEIVPNLALWPLAENLLLLAAVCAGAAICYNQASLAAASVAAFSLSLGCTMLALHLTITDTATGVILAGISAIYFLIWQLIKDKQGRFDYFRQTLEIAGHGAATLLLFLTYFNFTTISAYANQDYVRWNIALNFVLLAAIYAPLAASYKQRVAVDGAIFATIIALAIISPILSRFLIGSTDITNLSGYAVLLGSATAMLGFVLKEKTNDVYQKIYGQPTLQWGYGVAIVGLVFTLGQQYLTLDVASDSLALEPHNSTLFLVGVGSFIALSIFSAFACHFGKLQLSNQIQTGLSKERNASFWLCLALGLLPIFAWNIKNWDTTNFALVLTCLVVLDCGLMLWLAPSGRKEQAHYGPYTESIFLVAAVTSYFALGFADTQLWYEIGVTVALICLTTLLTFALKEARLTWLIAGLILWLTFSLNLLWNPENSVKMMAIAILAIVLLLLSEALRRDYGRAFFYTANLLFGLIAAFSLSWHEFNAGLLLGVLAYIAVALQRKQGYYSYVAGMFATAAVYVFVPDMAITAAEIYLFLGLALSAAIANPFSLRRLTIGDNLAKPEPATNANIETISRDAFSHLSHLWAVTALVLAYPNYPTLALIIPALIALYLTRSWYEQRAELLPVAAILTPLMFWNDAQLLPQLPAALLGPVLVALAACYLLIAQFYQNASQSASNFNNALADQIFSYSGQVLIGLGLLAALPDKFFTVIALSATTLLCIWLSIGKQKEWAYAAVGSGIAAYVLAFSFLTTNNPDAWNSFGLALFVPAVILAAVAFYLDEYADAEFNSISETLGWTALGLLLIGLPFSYQTDSLMLIHTLSLTVLGATLFRRSGRIEWLIGSIGASIWVVCLVIYIIHFNVKDYDLALLPVTALYFAATLYVAKYADWLEYATRLQAVGLLSATAQGMTVAAVFYSLFNNSHLAISLIALTAIYAFNFVVTRWTIWLYATLAALHLAYLSTLSSLFTGSGIGFTTVQGGLALLPLGLLMLILAVRLGVINNNQNLRGLSQQFSNENFAWADFAKLRSLPLYLAAALDMLISIGLTSSNQTLGFLVSIVIAAALLITALFENSESLVWIGLTVGSYAGILAYTGLAIPLTTVAIILAVVALLLTVIGYSVEAKSIFERPNRLSSHIAVGAAVLVWYNSTTYTTNVTAIQDSLSWLLALIGFNYIAVSTLEQRRDTKYQQEMRYLSYGSVMLLEAAFILRLVMSNVQQPQFYVVPVGLICLYFAWIERRYDNRRIAVLLEGLGLTVLLGMTLLQAFSFQLAGLPRNDYSLVLLAESLVVLAVGAAYRLRFYFFGGIAALLLDLLSMITNASGAGTQWLTLGITGLLLIGAAIVLERKRETLIQFSKDWLDQLHKWQ